MNLILALCALLVLISLPMAGCHTAVPANKPGGWHGPNGPREHWTQRPPTGPATERIVDKDGNPNFGPR